MSHREELGTPAAAVLAGSGGQNVEAVLDLRSALKALPARQRATIVLRYYDELSVKETANALGCSEGTCSVFNVDGLDVDIDVQGDRGIADITAAGGIVAYFQHEITLFGTNRANWTTDVVG